MPSFFPPTLYIKLCDGFYSDSIFRSLCVIGRCPTNNLTPNTGALLMGPKPKIEILFKTTTIILTQYQKHRDNIFKMNSTGGIFRKITVRVLQAQ
jgi:hypothetical protein